MHVGVDPERCQGHARCEAVSTLFTLDDDGFSSIGPAKEVPVGQEADARYGVESCPEGALSISGD